MRKALTVKQAVKILKWGQSQLCGDSRWWRGDGYWWISMDSVFYIALKQLDLEVIYNGCRLTDMHMNAA